MPIDLTIRGTARLFAPVLIAARYAGVSVTAQEGLPADLAIPTNVVLCTPEGHVTSQTAALRYVGRLAPDFDGEGFHAVGSVDSWVEFASNELEAAGLFVRRVRSELTTLANIGVLHSSRQVEVRAHVMATAASALASLEAHLATRTFLAGDRVTLADVAVACALVDYFALLLTPEDRAAKPNVTRWFQTCVHQPHFAAELGAVRLAGQERAGGQITLRAQAPEVAALADRAIALNKGFKKAQSQRQKEKAAKAAKNAGAAEESKAPAPAPAPAPTGGSGTASGDTSGLNGALFAKLAELNIDSETVQHEAVMTVDAMLEAVAGNVAGACTKNLFVKAKKKRDDNDSQLWLIVAKHDTAFKLDGIAEKLGYPKKCKFRFADESVLIEKLGVRQGSVTPLALLNAPAGSVNVAIDNALVAAGDVLVHPLINTASTRMSGADMVAFVRGVGHAPELVDF